jgi:para-nitrobenzyl esterase
MRQFLGIRYATPPTGGNRWQPPKPYCWHGNRSAVAMGSFCPQLTSFGNGNEDCLFLNIHTPPTGTYTKLPVMVFIHGGAFLGGAGSFYDPTELVKQGVIVVTFNYRLGALGFLAHPALDHVATRNTGMYGILDQQAALKWVKLNISKFGGNPNNVTIFGQSAGSFGVTVHLVSPLSKGLFHKAILQSGAPHSQATLAEAEVDGQAFANRAGCSSQKAACLRALSVSTILAKQDVFANNTRFLRLDHVVLKEAISAALSAGRFNKVPIINGATHDEYRFQLAGDQNLGTGDRCHFRSKITPATYGSLLPSVFFGLASRVEAEYPAGTTDLSANARFIAAKSDRDFICHALRSSDWIVQNGGTVYAYEFNEQKTPAPFGPIKLADGTTLPYGAFHAADLQYLFRPPGSTNACGLPLQKLSPAQQKLRSAMLTYWTRFAKIGNPNLAGTVPLWPRYQISGGQIMSLVASTPKPISASGYDAAHKCSAFWLIYVP